MIALDLGAAVAPTPAAALREPYQTHKPIAVGIMQREGIAQTMRMLRLRGYAANLEFAPVAFLEMM
jgi:hypothetical protein